MINTPSPPLHSQPKKPLIAYVVQIIAVLSAFNYASSIIYALVAFNKLGIAEIYGTIVVSSCVLLSSIFIFNGLGKNRFKRKRPVTAYLWVMLVLYPVINILRGMGMFYPAVHLENEQLPGAAILEFGRYIVFLALIVWSGISSGLSLFLAPPRQPESGIE